MRKFNIFLLDLTPNRARVFYSSSQLDAVIVSNVYFV